MNSHVESTYTSQSDDIDLFKLFALLWAKKHWIVLSALLFGLLGAAYAMTRTPQFQASAVVQLESRNNNALISPDIAEMLAPESEAATEIEIIKSQLVLKNVVEALKLDIVAHPQTLPFVGNFLSRYEFPRFSENYFKGYAWYGEQIAVEQFTVPEQLHGEALEITKTGTTTFDLLMPDGKVLRGVIGSLMQENDSGIALNLKSLVGQVGTRYIIIRRSPIDAINAIRDGLSVSEKARGTGVIRISMVSDAPSKSKGIVSEVVKSYIEQNVGRSAEEAEKSLVFLKEQLPQIQKTLALAEADLNEYRLESRSIDLTLEAQSILEQSVRLDAQISALSLEETELSRRYTSNHPTYKALLEKKRRLTDEKSALAQSVQTLPSTQQEILRKTRDVEVSQQIYVQLLNKSQELSVMKAGTVGNVRLLDPSVAKFSAVEPNIPVLTLLASILGAGLMALAVLVRQNVSLEIDSPEDLVKLGAPVLAVVPLSTFQKNSSRKRKFALLSREQPSEVAVEALRSLRTNIYFNLHERDRNIISVTGPSPTVGKSFVSSNLAYLAASSGVKVLLIDGDMRRGNLGRNFNLQHGVPGLAQLLDGTKPANEVMYDIDLDTLSSASVRPNETVSADFVSVETETVSGLYDSLDYEIGARRSTPEDGGIRPVQGTAFTSLNKMTVVPRGNAPANPAELLMSNRLPEFLERASQDFELVIVDTPPVLAATDATIIGKYSDINIMVVRQGETTTHEASEVAKAFSNNRSRITGIVLNGYDANRGKYGKYGAQYGYSYYY